MVTPNLGGALGGRGSSALRVGMVTPNLGGALDGRASKELRPQSVLHGALRLGMVTPNLDGAFGGDDGSKSTSNGCQQGEVEKEKGGGSESKNPRRRARKPRTRDGHTTSIE